MVDENAEEAVEIAPDAVVEADSDTFSDTDSALGGESLRESTGSLTSTILRYRQENGRTYHAYKDGNYILPNDEEEQNRLDLQHHLFMLTFENKLALCPLPDKVHRVLDVGTGTGIWAIDFADEHPEAEVIGIDLSPTQPRFVPPNLRFEVDDAEELWTYSNKFDYIHGRMMNASFSDWPKFFTQCYDNLEPGGWLEMQDLSIPMKADDDSWPQDSALRQLNDLILKAGPIMNRPTDVVQRYKTLITEAGFDNVTEIIYKWPSNTWPKDKKYKELGMWSHADLSEGLEGMVLALFTRVLGWSLDEVTVLLAKARADLSNRSIHAYWPIHVVYGQKPGSKSRGASNSP